MGAFSYNRYTETNHISVRFKEEYGNECTKSTGARQNIWR